MPDGDDAPVTGDTSDGVVRVLFVDDHKMVADSLAAVVNDEPDLEVVGVAENLAQAISMTNALTPDVVVMDYRLPDGDGAEGTRRIRALGRAPEVVVLTASGDDQVLRDALGAGACSFLTKGGNIDNLLQAVRSSARGESVFSPDVVRRLARVSRAVASPSTDALSSRELEVLRAIAAGQGTAQIARTLVLSEHTVRNHVRNVLAKLGAHTKLEAVVIAARDGLITIGSR